MNSLCRYALNVIRKVVDTSVRHAGVKMVVVVYKLQILAATTVI